MSATITDILKTDMLKTIFDKTQNVNVAIGDSDRHYIAIGRSEDWTVEATPPIPYSDNDTSDTFRSSIQSMKLVPDVSYVVPRFSWVSGNFYEAWSPEFGSNTEVINGVTPTSASIPNPYYVLTDDNNVFVCIQQGKTATGSARASIHKPIDTTGAVFFAGGDGYFWKFLYNIGAAEARKFLTSTYMPVERIVDVAAGGPVDEDLSVSRLQQRGIQGLAIPGQIIGIAVDDPGTNYSATPTITIHGRARQGVSLTPANTALATANVEGGLITSVVMKSDPANTTFDFGRDYADASVSIADGTGSGAVLRALISTDSGMGGNAILDLSASAMMFNTQLSGAENADFQVNNQFRQIGIIRNPLKDSAQYGSFVETAPATSATLSAFKRLHVIGTNLAPENITGDQIITQETTGSAAVIDYYDTVAGIMYVHQTRETGFRIFDSNYSCNVSGGGGSTTPVSIAGQYVLRPSEVDVYSGEVIYIDNRVAVSRDNDQTEDIKVVVDL